MVTDPVADALTRIRNAQMVHHRSVSVLGSKMVGWVLDVLKREGYIDGFKVKEEEGKPGRKFEVQLRYSPRGEPVVSLAKRVSTPGRRVYSSFDSIPRIHRGLGIAILSTSKGVMSDREARSQKIGGEVLAYVG